MARGSSIGLPVRRRGFDSRYLLCCASGRRRPPRSATSVPPVAPLASLDGHERTKHVPARCSGSNTVCKIVERGSTPRRASNASARGRDQRLLNAGLRDRHAPEALRRIRLVAQDAGFSIRQRGFDSLMRRRISTHGGQQVYEASSGSSTLPGDTTLLFVVGTIAALRRLRTGFDSRRRDRWDGATVAHEFHTLGISRFNSDPSNADDPRRDARFISAAAEVRVPSSALERRLTAGRRLLTPFISVRIRALQQESLLKGLAPTGKRCMETTIQ